MTIGIIGAGTLGSNLARLLAKSRVAATIANSRGPASLGGLAQELGPLIRPGTLAQAASADIVVVALRWVDVAQALSGMPAWNGRVVIDATNPVEFLDPDSPDARDPGNPLAAYGIKAIDLGGKHSSQVVRALLPGAHVVKAFNHLDARVLSQPVVPQGQRVLFYSGDHPQAKGRVRELIGATGGFPVDLGPLDVGGPLMELPFGALAAAQFIRV